MFKMTRSSIVASLLAPTFVIGTVAATMATTACTDREVARVDPRQNKEQEKEIPVQINRDIDILFVIDDSGSMRDEQESLAANFNNFVNVLENIEGGLPNVHIGVVSTDIGAGPFGIMGCTGNGDNGVLQSAATGACTPPGPEPFIIDTAAEDGVSRVQNFSGANLADTFSCIAQLGIGGCGFEQPLESMRRALNGSNVQNTGFLRENAFLAVIIITDEDDCSVEDVSMFDSNPNLDVADSEVGFLSSFRCFEFGVTCDPNTPRSAGPRQDCVPRTDSPFMYDVGEYATFLKGLKSDPSQIIVAGIIGNPSPVTVGSNDSEPTLEPSCVSGAGEADPAVRIKSFLDAFPQRNTSTTICNDDLSDALTVIAELLAKAIGNPCIEGNLLLTDGEPECTVADVQNLNQDGQSEDTIAKCNATADNFPCYRFEEDTEQCSTETNLVLIIERGTTDPGPNTTVVARCVAQ